MMKLLSLLLLSVAAYAHVEHERVVINNRRSFPAEYNQLGLADASSPVTFYLALKQQNMDKLEKLFWQVSDPDSKMYGQYMTVDQLRAFVAANPEITKKVMQWLLSNGIAAEDISDFGDSIRVRTTAQLAEKLFETTMYEFQAKSTGLKIVRQLGEFSLPTSLVFGQEIELIEGLYDFPPADEITMTEQKMAKSNAQAYAVIPKAVMNIYDIGALDAASHTTAGVAAFAGEPGVADGDYDVFMPGVGSQARHYKSFTTKGPFQPTASVESTLDVDCCGSIAARTDFYFLSSSSWMYSFTQEFMDYGDYPAVFSMSYGWNEEEQCNTEGGPADCSLIPTSDSKVYIARTNSEFMKIGMLGVTVISASGDSGVNGRTDPACTEDHFNPPYPAACPYLTAVGATQLSPPDLDDTYDEDACTTYACPKSGPEDAVAYEDAGFTSGGGFSNVAPMPDYQKDAIAAYMASGVELPPTSYFNTSGRGFPDIAAIGSQNLIYYSSIFGGQYQPVGGTSASAPLIAGVLALLNDALVSGGYPQLGFANPLLYKMAAECDECFTDITVGENKCTESGCFDCKGFVCAAGWDPVTGLGTPVYSAMKDYVLAQAAKRVSNKFAAA